MKSEIDIQSLWKEQQTPIADLSAIRKKIKAFRLSRIGEALAVIVLLNLAAIAGMIIWIYWTPRLISTQIGIALLFIGFTLPILSHGRLLFLYYGLKVDGTNMDYLKRLLKTKKEEYRWQTIVLNLYFLFLSFGFGLYIYEYTFCRSFFFGIIAYVVLLLWIALNWFVFRPHIIEKRNRKFDDFMKYIKNTSADSLQYSSFKE